MSEKIFPCSSCGAQMQYAPGASLKCPFCGALNEIPKSGELIEELDYHAYLKTAANETEAMESQVVKCVSCGAETSLPENTAFGCCPFCGASISARPSGTRKIKPKSLLPFAVDENQARKNFRLWMSNLWFAPRQMKEFARVQGGLKGVYIPFWTYDAAAFSSYTGERGTDYTVTETYSAKDSDGSEVQKERAVTKTRWSRVSGSVSHSFDDVLVLASRSLPRNLTDKLEPWDLTKLEPFSDAYLAGFSALSHQIDLAEGFDLAEEIMADHIKNLIERDIGGDHQRILTVSTNYSDITFKHVLLPIWVNAYRFRDKIYQFVVNGCTGEVQGERPWSWLKIVAAALAAAGAGGLIFWIVRHYS